MNKKWLLLSGLIVLLLFLSSCYSDEHGCSKCEFFNETNYLCQKSICCENDDCFDENKCIFPGTENSFCAPKNTCDDGTEHNTCSEKTSGNLCFDGELYEKCNRCDCKNGYKCVDLTCEIYETEILLVHGFNSDQYAWKRFKTWFDQDRIKVHTINLVPSIGNITQLSYQLAGKIKTLIRDNDIDKVDIVAHSMGGLVTRTYIHGPFYENKINKFIMLGTPNLGVLMSGFNSFQLEETIASKQMTRYSEFIKRLNEHALNKNIIYFTIIGTKYSAYGIQHDGLVLEEEVKLPDVDFKTFDLSHSGLLESYDVYLLVKSRLEQK